MGHSAKRAQAPDGDEYSNDEVSADNRAQPLKDRKGRSDGVAPGTPGSPINEGQGPGRGKRGGAADHSAVAFGRDAWGVPVHHARWAAFA